jgi:NitT/TauT family transport system substrate-binding protein
MVALLPPESSLRRVNPGPVATLRNLVETMLRIFSILLAMAGFMLAETPGAKPSFTVGWSVYAGWTPYHYLMQSGIMRKWADKYGIATKIQRTLRALARRLRG